ncbi:protease modulator HflC [Candidatus Magnetaquicoccus inordinatus]|uniref:protease modulator HflC n=1 Tax=Candidatus Magnetaquicoccus inordinatus TaxID=2496818 RepID=UPI00102CD5C4|nr:protease modulator HflC [Candidatus Magnetaquicoccus inordinatus]
MKLQLLKGATLLVVALLAILFQSAFTVHQVEQVLIVQLGKPIRPITEPGLHFKIPFIQEVLSFDRRLLIFDQDPQEVLSSDKKNLKVDNYALWRIVDPLRYFQTVRHEEGATSRLSDIIYSNIREVLGQYTMMEIVAGSRADLVTRIRDQANQQAAQYGIEIVDVRIQRTDLPPENSKAVFRRMQTERERQAKTYRAQGEEEAVKIRSHAAREREVLLANAYKESQELRGQGDADATRIYADAYRRDPEFYEFKRTLDAYEKAFSKETTLLLESNGFFRYLQGMHSMDPKGGAVGNRLSGAGRSE